MFNYIAPINGTGYGTAGIGYAKGLHSLGIDFNLVPIGQVDNNNLDIKNDKVLQDLLSKSKPIDKDRPNFIFWHFHDMKNRVQHDPQKSIAFSTFELDTLTKEEAETIKNYAGVGSTTIWHHIVLCGYASSILETPIPHAYKVLPDEQVPTIKEDDPVKIWASVLGLKLNKQTLVLSSCGKYEKRKGFDTLLECLTTSDLDFPILLVAFWHNPFSPEGFPYSALHMHGWEPIINKASLKLFRKGHNMIVLMPPAPTRAALHGALARAHFFVAPSRAEGWNLPLFEMMSLGMPSLATDCPGHVHYLPIKHSLTIKCTQKETAIDLPFFNGQGSWYILDAGQILKAICAAAYLRDQANAYNACKQEYRLSVNNYSWQQSASLIVKEMQKLGLLK